MGAADPIPGDVQGRHHLELDPQRPQCPCGDRLRPFGAVFRYGYLSERRQLPGLPEAGVCSAPPDPLYPRQNRRGPVYGDYDRNFQYLRRHHPNRDERAGRLHYHGGIAARRDCDRDRGGGPVGEHPPVACFPIGHPLYHRHVLYPIARAFLKDVPIILLDESTASIDPRNETKIQEAIGRLIKNKTVLIIAHKLRSIVEYDKIVVLQEGRLVEAGTHDALMEQPGLYHKPYSLQNKSLEWTVTTRSE